MKKELLAITLIFLLTTSIYTKRRNKYDYYDRAKSILHSFGEIFFGLGLLIFGVGATILTLGFVPAGVAAGSAAALIQSTIGNVVAGSTFSALTSIGMTGGQYAAIGAGLSSMAVGGAIIANSDDETENDEK
jgi:hypothetical protein